MKHTICDECETVVHCSNNGCIPKQPANVADVNTSAKRVAEMAKSVHEQSEFMTQAELAKRWKLSEASLERMRYMKKGCKYLKIGGLIRYRVQDVLAYEQSCLHEPKTFD
jgi:hypothetical protein